MTKAGVAFTIAGVLGYFVASQTQIGWLYLFDAVIWGVLLLSAFVPWYSLRSLSVDRQVLLPRIGSGNLSLDGPLEDDTVEVRLRVTSHGRFSRYFVSLLEECPFDRPEERRKAFFLTRLPPRGTTAFSYTADCYQRGYYASADVILSSSAPLGLFRKRRNFSLPLRLTVYPRYFLMDSLPFAVESWAEQGPAVRSGAASEFYGSRQYHSGDPLRHIHWRNTARIGQFMIKEFEQAGQGSVSVIFAASRVFGDGRETTLEYSLRVAASLAGLCAASGRGIDIITGAEPLHNAGWSEAMHYLARLETGTGKTLPELLPAVEPGKTVVAVVPVADPDSIPALESLARRVGGLFVVLLEGFSPEEDADAFTSRLQGRNIAVVRGSLHSLEDAIRKLSESLASAANTSMVVP
ncbi:MAG: DUF58 domain-containing protein [Chloroflexi bacterium]|nr:DUF58 domain-containing protein [Chloroflexota bacterium]